MEKLLIPLFAVLFMFSACTGSLPSPEESSGNNSKPQTEQSVPENESSLPENDSEDITIIDPVVSPDGKLTVVCSKDEIYVTDENGEKTYLDLSLCPKDASVKAALWRQGKVYMTFTGEKDTVLCWDMENDPVYIKEGIKNTLSPLTLTEYDVIAAGDNLLIPYHDGTMDSPVLNKDMVLGYVVYYSEMQEGDITLTLNEGGESVSVLAVSDSVITVLNYETEKAVSEAINVKAGEQLFINCVIPEGFPAYKIQLVSGDCTATFTLSYDGRGETNVYFLTPDTYK